MPSFKAISWIQARSLIWRRSPRPQRSSVGGRRSGGIWVACRACSSSIRPILWTSCKPGLCRCYVDPDLGVGDVDALVVSIFGAMSTPVVQVRKR